MLLSIVTLSLMFTESEVTVFHWKAEEKFGVFYLGGIMFQFLNGRNPSSLRSVHNIKSLKILYLVWSLR